MSHKCASSVQNARLQANLTQTQLAKACNVKTTEIVEIENGTARYNAGLITAIEKAVNTKVDRGRGSKKNKKKWVSTLSPLKDWNCDFTDCCPQLGHFRLKALHSKNFATINEISNVYILGFLSFQMYTYFVSKITKLCIPKCSVILRLKFNS